MHHIYIVECRDGTYYTGYTNNVKKRIIAHNKGKGAKYTRGRGPVILRHQESYETKSDAMRREYHIKQLSRQDKNAYLTQIILNLKE